MIARRRLAAAAVSSALLAGCAALAPPVPGDRLAGRLAVQVEGDAQRSFSSAFELSGSAERGRLVLTSPLGTQMGRAEWSPGRAELDDGRQQRHYADLQDLAEQALGERVPIAALFDWLRGRPTPGAPSEPQPGGFEQLGWRVDVSRRDAGLVEAKRDSTPRVTVRARLDAP
ncbi:MAG TPA: outer membrane lipoprotein LolB [Methylibium sp.]|uniref:outer membrane lipoprotein LolB n=1 Tax=Methylibium sp. TaxID=2067992 RepID=UPI002DBC1A24|nr:outer membrane lipoprotein LolB [Methylibium sp.]HEU4457909.1 outer membrane lipoprotein LolB [Methylibium sp.]